jgi:hypothetical protein
MLGFWVMLVTTAIWAVVELRAALVPALAYEQAVKTKCEG